MGVFKHSEEIWAQESHVWSQRGMGKRPPDPLQRICPCIVRQNNRPTCSSFPKTWHIYIIFQFNLMICQKKKPKTCFFQVFSPQKIATRCSGNGPWWPQCPGLGELVRPQRLPPAEGRGGGTAKTKVGTSRAWENWENNESWHGKKSSPESENVEMYSFITF
jgi:hypothetical protein